MIAVSERDQDRERKRLTRASGKDVSIPACASPGRRKAAEVSPFTWLETYVGHRFYNPMTDTHREIVREVLHRIESGGDKAIAAPRGDGKTTVVKFLILYCLLTGRLRFPVMLAANGTEAKEILDDIKSELEENDLLAADYPEVCVPIRALERWAANARKQTVGGKPTNIKWADDMIVLPTVKGSKSTGACLRTRGMDAAIRGMNRRGMRPDFVLIDDPETEESAESDKEIEKRERKIDRAVAGLAGQSRKMGRLILCTIQNQKCLAARYTDLKIKQSWGGRRYRQLIKKPDREDLWEQYISMLRTGQEDESDPDGIKATKFYEENRAAMDAGAVLSNTYRFDIERGEVSALQACFNYIARNGWDSFSTEFQNDPPETDGPQESGITATLVASRVNGRNRWEVPADAVALTIGLDLSDRSSHWVATAWLENCVGLVVGYGVIDVAKATDKQTRALAVSDALHNFRTTLQADAFKVENGDTRQPDLVLIDSGDGDHTAAVYKFQRDVGRPYWASKGVSPFHPGQPAAGKREVGNRWYRSKQTEMPGRGLWLTMLDADHWKRFVHERFLTETFDKEHFYRPGSLSLFSPQVWNEHHSYSHHIVAEVWTTEFKEGRGEKSGWYIRSKQNHYLDATAMACAAADMCGVRLLVKPTGPAVQRPRPPVRPTLRMPDGRPFLVTER